MKHLRFIVFLFALCLSTAPALIDTNHNSMSDLWEEFYNSGQLFPADFTSVGDSDGDGQSNLAEATAGTDPVSSANYFKAEVIHIPATYLTPAHDGDEPEINTPEAFCVQWSSVIGKQYTVEFSLDLSAGSWSPLGTPITGDGSTIQIGFAYESWSPEKLFWRVSVTEIESATSGISEYERNLLLTTAGTWNEDPDGDGLTNAEEYANGFNPNLADSNGDGISDLQQYSIDHPESTRDTDGDGAPDSLEFAKGSNALDPNSTPTADPLVAYEVRKLSGRQGSNQNNPTTGYSSSYTYRQSSGNDNYDTVTFFPAALDPATVHTDLLGNLTYRAFSEKSGHIGPQDFNSGVTLLPSGQPCYGPSIHIYAVSHDIPHPEGAVGPARIITNSGMKLRLTNKWKVPQDVSFSYVKVHLKAPMPAGPMPQGTSTDTFFWQIPASAYTVVDVDTEIVKLTILKGAKESTDYELAPPIVEAGICHLVILIPVDLEVAIPNENSETDPPVLTVAGNNMALSSAASPTGSANTPEIDIVINAHLLPKEKKLTEGGWAVVNFDDDDQRGNYDHGNTSATPDLEFTGAIANENDMIRVGIKKIALDTNSNTPVKYRFKYDNSNIRLWKKSNRSEQVTSEQTEYTIPATENFAVAYVEGIKPHDDDNGTIITAQVKIGTANWQDADTAKIRVAHSVMVCYGEGRSEWSNQEDDPSLATYLFDKANVTENPWRLRKLIKSSSKSETCVVPGKSQSGNNVCYSVTIMGDDKTKTSMVAQLALKNPYANVVFAGHANWGVGMAFGKNFTSFSDFFWTSSGGKPAVNIAGFHEHPQISTMVEINGIPYTNPATVFALWNSMIVTPAQNRFLTGQGIVAGIERYPNVLTNILPSITRTVPPVDNASTPADETIFDIHHELRTRIDGSTSTSNYHYVADPNEDGDGNTDQRVILQRPGGTDVPALHYRSLFMNQCNSYRYFIESFQQGTVLSTWQNIQVSVHTQLYVQSLVEGKQWSEIETLLEAKEAPTGTGNAFRRGLIEISNFPHP